MPKIEKMIVHKLNLTEDSPILSDGLVDLKSLDDAKVALDFFTKHIKNNRTQSATKKSKFKNGNAYIVKNSVIEIVKNLEKSNIDEVFIKESQRITEHFANSIRGKSSSDGSVVVLLYKYEERPYIGILKMDPNLGIQVIKVEDKLTIEVQPDILPSINEKLHKSAFIILKDSYDEKNIHDTISIEETATNCDDIEDVIETELDNFDLFILDKQQSKSEVAKFFMNDFLASLEVANNDNLTEIIQKSIIEVFDDLIVVENDSVQTIKQKIAFKHVLAHRFTLNEEFSVDEHLPNIVNRFVPEDLVVDEAIQTVKDKVSRVYPDAVFKLIPNPKKVQPIVYKSEDNNVKIEITGEIFEGDISEEENDFEFKIDDQGNTIFIFKPHLQIEAK